MSADPRPKFGFADLGDIKPDLPSRERAPDLVRADQVAERHGFTSREVVRRRKRQPIDEPVDQINLRAAITDINRFVDWCERNRYSYREGFSELVKRIV